MTNEQQLVKLLACAIHQLGGSLEISNELLDKMMPVQLMLDTESDPKYIKLMVLSAQILLAEVDEDKVSVIL